MPNNKIINRLRAIIAAGRALLNSGEREHISLLLNEGDRDRAVFVAMCTLSNHVSDQLNALSGDLQRVGLNPDLFGRLQLLGSARDGLTRPDMDMVLEMLITTRTGFYVLDDLDHPDGEKCGPLRLSSTFEGVVSYYKMLDRELTQDGGAFFERGIQFRRSTREVPLIELLPHGGWDEVTETSTDPEAQPEPVRIS